MLRRIFAAQQPTQDVGSSSMPVGVISSADLEKQELERLEHSLQTAQQGLVAYQKQKRESDQEYQKLIQEIARIEKFVAKMTEGPAKVLMQENLDGLQKQAHEHSSNQQQQKIDQESKRLKAAIADIEKSLADLALDQDADPDGKINDFLKSEKKKLEEQLATVETIAVDVVEQDLIKKISNAKQEFIAYKFKKIINKLKSEYLQKLHSEKDKLIQNGPEEEYIKSGLASLACYIDNPRQELRIGIEQYVHCIVAAIETCANNLVSGLEEETDRLLTTMSENIADAEIQLKAEDLINAKIAIVQVDLQRAREKANITMKKLLNQTQARMQLNKNIADVQESLEKIKKYFSRSEYLSQLDDVSKEGLKRQEIHFTHLLNFYENCLILDLEKYDEFSLAIENVEKLFESLYSPAGVIKLSDDAHKKLQDLEGKDNLEKEKENLTLDIEIYNISLQLQEMEISHQVSKLKSEFLSHLEFEPSGSLQTTLSTITKSVKSLFTTLGYNPDRQDASVRMYASKPLFEAYLKALKEYKQVDLALSADPEKLNLPSSLSLLILAGLKIYFNFANIVRNALQNEEELIAWLDIYSGIVQEYEGFHKKTYSDINNLIVLQLDKRFVARLKLLFKVFPTPDVLLDLPEIISQLSSDKIKVAVDDLQVGYAQKEAVETDMAEHKDKDVSVSVSVACDVVTVAAPSMPEPVKETISNDVASAQSFKERLAANMTPEQRALFLGGPSFNAASLALKPRAELVTFSTQAASVASTSDTQLPAQKAPQNMLEALRNHMSARRLLVDPHENPKGSDAASQGSDCDTDDEWRSKPGTPIPPVV